MNDGTRLLASSSAAMAISEVDRANLQDYVGQKALNPFIDIEKILKETRKFAIPGTQWPAAWEGSLNSRPKWWGKLVIELIYDTLDPDVAEYLKNNKPEPDVRWHQQLTENIGVRQLVSRCYEVIGMAKTCKDIRELKQKVAEHYGKKPVQFTMYL